MCLITEYATDCCLAPNSLMGCLGRVECKFLMALRWRRSRASRQWFSHWAVYTFPTTEVGICGVGTSSLALKAIYRAKVIWYYYALVCICFSLDLLGFLQ